LNWRCKGKRKEISDMVDVDKLIKNTVKKGDVKLGTKQAKQMLIEGKAKLAIIASNCPYSAEITELASKKNIPVYNYEANAIDLGYTCGKAYGVSVLTVIDDGGENILQLVKKR
jgi:large subunit ribosomal protein L30e